ncbi:hypothetical protein PCCS19_48970 [Paenibacillus sp. CCS19]|uniref:Yip1 family protein n=1 Tax=Paenibacillus sp. CCS19 TaxID=3158387 RepID=UPI002562B5B1|nr:Yip1 family protein [Paenibacillus cellulosilyticus]GMK41838.1 hypothetical protein PCCS19_48970 [Paenibacillus cellulosilyticus]
MKVEWLRFPLHVIVRPFDGFWDMKYEKKGKGLVALLILVLLIVAVIIQKQFSGFLVNFNDPRYLNSIDEFKYILLPFVLWCLGNWSVTTLLDGEGRLKEIMITTAYALTPLVLIYYPTTLMSNFLTNEESSFFYLLNSFAGLWFIWLLFVGMMTVHQYTAAKTIVTMLLTIVVMAIIVFLGMLVFSLIQQIIGFVYSIYYELIFRN